MTVINKEQQFLSVSPEKLLAVVRAFLDGDAGREDDNNPLPPGPWDPVIRSALERVSLFGSYAREGNMFGPRPEPWKLVVAIIAARHPEIWDAVGGGSNLLEKVALNPQPLPPRIAFLISTAQTVIQRAELFQEFADASSNEGEQRSIIIVSGYIGRFVDDFCGTGFRLRYPFPGPRPNWFTSEFNGIDLVVMATQFEQAAKDAFSPKLGQALMDASANLMQAGLAKMQ